MLKPFSDIIFARHCVTVREKRRKKKLHNTRKIMTDNHNMNETLIKDVQQQNFSFKTACRVTEMFRKIFFCVFASSIVLFFSRLYIDGQASTQDLR